MDCGHSVVHISACSCSRYPSHRSRWPFSSSVIRGQSCGNDNFEDWLDNAYSFSISLLNDHVSLPGNSAHFSRNLPTNDHQTSIFISLDPDTATEGPELPRSPKALVKEARINKIRDFLGTRDRPPNLSDADYTSFINAVTQFFLLNVSLYCRKPHGRHQLVILIERRYGLIREAHDTLGHKGIFSV